MQPPVPMNEAAWRERERRQRTVRVLMMFLMMLLLMDDDAEYAERQSRLRKSDLSKLHQQQHGYRLEETVFAARQHQQETLHEIAQYHTRYQALVELNGGVDFDSDITEWCLQQAEIVKDEFEQDQPPVVVSNSKTAEFADETSTIKVWHYPWNTTGFYRGDWSRVVEIDELVEASARRQSAVVVVNNNNSRTTTTTQQQQQVVRLNAVQLEPYMLKELRDRDQVAAVVPLPPGYQLLEPWRNETTTDTSKVLLNKEIQQVTSATTEPPPAVTLTRDDGRAAFQLFSKSIAGVKELSVVTGFVKLYDSTAAGYSTRKDVLLRVRGVLLHSIGRVSLVSNVAVNEMALVLDPVVPKAKQKSRRNKKKTKRVTTANNDDRRRRRLQRAVAAAESLSAVDMDQVRNDALALYGDEHDDQKGFALVSENYEEDPSSDLGAEEEDKVSIPDDDDSKPHQESEDTRSERLGTKDLASQQQKTSAVLRDGSMESDETTDVWSNIVIPYPFVRDDKDGTIRNARTPASRTMPQREQALEANAAGCVFEINMDVNEVEWTVGAWRKLVAGRVEEVKKLDPALQPEPTDESEQGDSKNRRARAYSAGTGRRQRRAKPAQDQALVMNMVGTIHSPNCNFTAYLNTTALRTDWDATTSKAINYSFYMMIVCLTQILILLRQLLHSQSQSTATRVSLMCIGWQTVIDALLCLAHIYLSLAVQPLFTAFASVAFFKLLIFCVIEMKYMAIIIQARNSSNGGQPTDVLRRQVAMLHLRFYGALLATFLLMFYAPGKYRVYYMLALYSFWVPQIILNIVSEAKTPLHKHYIYGMSLTRMVAPLYIFGLRNNFLKEVYPESATDPFMCQMVVLWIGCQTAILIAQGKYGARFMIPARFLPPKFDYSRPIPPSMLPPGALLDLPAPELMEDRDDTLRVGGSPKREDDDDGQLQPCEHRPLRHQTAETTRNRHKGSRLNHQGSSMTTEDLTLRPPPAVPAPSPVLECSICYDAIDIRDRQKYMLAPCNHLFHRECLAQWMDVKMECPICRTELPAL
jgi:transmembrane E3 ubiquitin-protein ligase